MELVLKNVLQVLMVRQVFVHHVMMHVLNVSVILLVNVVNVLRDTL